MAIIFLLILIVFVWRYRQTPLVKLERQLKQKKVMPREAAHCLANYVNTSIISDKRNSLLQRINQLRFQRQLPSTIQLMLLIQKAKNEL